MASAPPTDYIAALINLHAGLDRKGPGDADFSEQILRQISGLPHQPRIADLGCGSGAGALQLAQYYQTTVLAVDMASVFIEELEARARQAGLEHLITPICSDMANLNWPAGSLDLIWSEGSAYNLGFEAALQCWRPFLAEAGRAVISEMSWFTDHPSKEAIAFWQNAYPTMGTETENIRRAHRSGFRVISTHRLPSRAWWNNYYNPLRQKIQHLAITPTLQAVIQETEEEIRLFEQFSDCYGYTFYVLQAV